MKNTDMGRTSVADEIDSDAPITGSDEELTRVEAGMGLDLSDVSVLFILLQVSMPELLCSDT